MKINCWEYKKCGREPGGINASKLGVCPAATETRVNRVNNGKNGGRCCWAIAGTLCGGEVQGTFSRKLAGCIRCDFYKMVFKEERSSPLYRDAKEIQKMIRPFVRKPG